jgi:hypothetical protein
MRRTATGVAAAFGATAVVDFPDVWAQLVNDPAETAFIADAAAEVVGEAHVDRNRSLIMGSEDFAYMLEACPGAFINIGIGDTDGPFHSPSYDFNDAALPIGASLFARLVEKKYYPAPDIHGLLLVEPGSRTFLHPQSNANGRMNARAVAPVDADMPACVREGRDALTIAARPC